MLVLPLNKESQKIPVVTICLILLSCLIFFGFQRGEEEGYTDAQAFALASGLLRMEAPVYKTFLKLENRTLPPEFREDQNSEAFYAYMLKDDAFQHKLLSDQLITPADKNYKHWQELRQILAADLDRGFLRSHGFSPARGNYSALVTSMFLHTSFLQLLVNMTLLWFVGSLLEIGLGRRWLGCYVLAGFVGSALFGLVFPIAQGPLLGSGAALAGLMGLYGLVYSRSTLRAVHSLKYTLDYPKVPGWFLLPLWGLSELVQVVSFAGANGAYVAHVGGLLTGFACGAGAVLLLRQQTATHKPVVVEGNGEDKVDELLGEVDLHLAAERHDKARELVLAVLKLESENRLALIHLFDLDKKNPESDRFHSTASMVLGNFSTIKGRGDIEKYFEEYRQLCPGAKMPPDLLIGVATSYVHSGKTERASRILAILLKVAPDNVGLPACLFNLAQMYRAGNKQKRAKKCLRILAVQYPETNSGRKAKEFLSPQLHHTFGSEDS